MSGWLSRTSWRHLGRSVVRECRCSRSSLPEACLPPVGLAHRGLQPVPWWWTTANLPVYLRRPPKAIMLLSIEATACPLLHSASRRQLLLSRSPTVGSTKCSMRHSRLRPTHALWILSLPHISRMRHLCTSLLEGSLSRSSHSLIYCLSIYLTIFFNLYFVSKFRVFSQILVINYLKGLGY